MYIGSQLKFILVVLLIPLGMVLFLSFQHSEKNFNPTEEVFKLKFPKENKVFTEIPIEKKIKIEAGDNLYGLLKNLSINDNLINQIILDDSLKEFSKLIVNETLLMVKTAENIKIIKYKGVSSPSILEITSFDYSLYAEKKLFEKFIFFREFEINESLYVSAKEANIPNTIIGDLIFIFGWDIDFVFDIRKGDSVKLLYEDIYFNGTFFLHGDIIAAEFINQGDKLSVVKFSQKGRKDYFSTDSTNIRKAFLKTPIEFARISSHYNPNRKHPILNTIRAHKGTDYSAKVGTPIKVTGDGVVVKAEYSESYGNYIDVQHFNTYTTRYAHLNNFAKGIKSGLKVNQGEIIGYVGSTGLATGPHLHYEFHINGRHTNPVKIEPPNAEPINAYNMDIFNKIVNERVTLMENLSQK